METDETPVWQIRKSDMSGFLIDKMVNTKEWPWGGVGEGPGATGERALCLTLNHVHVHR